MAKKREKYIHPPASLPISFPNMVFVVVVLQGQERPTNRPANPPTEQTKSAAGSRCCSRLPTPTPPPTPPPPPPPLKRGEGTFQGERTIRSYELTTATAAAATKPTGKEEAGRKEEREEGRKRFWAVTQYAVGNSIIPLPSSSISHSGRMSAMDTG